MTDLLAQEPWILIKILPVLKPRPLARVNLVEAHGLLLLTVRRLQATLNLKLVQLQANHTRERAEEQQRKSQLETELQQRGLSAK